MKYLYLIIINIFALTGCAEIGIVSKNNSFSTHETLILSSNDKNWIDSIEEIGIKLGYKVYLKEGDKIQIYKRGSGVSAVAIGKYSASSMTFTIDKDNKIAKVLVEVEGNMGSGDQGYAKKIFEEFKNGYADKGS